MDDAVAPGERGAILRWEDVYGSTVSRWRLRRDEAVRARLSDVKRGPKVDEWAREVRDLRRQNELTAPSARASRVADSRCTPIEAGP